MEYLEKVLKIYTEKLNSVTDTINKIEMGKVYVSEMEHKKLLFVQKEYCNFVKILINVGKELYD